MSIEANSALTQAAIARFSEAIARGRLTVVHEGIARPCGEMDFFINPDQDDGSSFDAMFAARTPSSRIERVYCRPLDDFFERFGVPYYLKVDMKGTTNSASRPWNAPPSFPAMCPRRPR